MSILPSPRLIGAGVSLVLLTSIFCGTRLFSRVETTLVGYKIGELKRAEAILLEKNSQLRMELAKISSKSHLLVMAQDGKKAKSISSLAAN